MKLKKILKMKLKKNQKWSPPTTNYQPSFFHCQTLLLLFKPRSTPPPVYSSALSLSIYIHLYLLLIPWVGVSQSWSSSIIWWAVFNSASDRIRNLIFFLEFYWIFLFELLLLDQSRKNSIAFQHSRAFIFWYWNRWRDSDKNYYFFFFPIIRTFIFGNYHEFPVNYSLSCWFPVSKLSVLIWKIGRKKKI